MATPSTVRKAQGSWKGRSRLNLPWLPEPERITESDSLLEVFNAPEDTFAQVTYTWEYEGVVHRGCWIFAGKKVPEGDCAAGVTGAWTDSWHQNTSILQVAESGPQGDAVRLLGEYSGGEGPKWGWRLELQLVSSDSLEFRMVNISPEGVEEWAQHGIYSRAQ
jgi:hypothetical protein